MKVDKIELVKRYHVIFNEEESDFLRARSFLHPLSQPSTDMWVTIEEIDFMKNLFKELIPAIDEMMSSLPEPT